MHFPERNTCHEERYGTCCRNVISQPIDSVTNLGGVVGNQLGERTGTLPTRHSSEDGGFDSD